MTISNLYDFDLTRNQIIAGALRLLGVIGQGQTPDANQYSDCAEALNIMLKAWEAEGLPLWAIKIQAIPLVAGQRVYSIGPSKDVDTQKPLKLYQSYYRQTSNVDIPMTSLSQSEYNNLGNKTTPGRPIQYYYENLLDYGNLYVFPVPTSSEAGENIYITYQRPFADFDSATDTADVPQEFLRALKYNLAMELALEFGYPTQDRNTLLQMAERYRQQAFAFNQEEESLTFQVDRREY